MAEITMQQGWTMEDYERIVAEHKAKYPDGQPEELTLVIPAPTLESRCPHCGKRTATTCHIPCNRCGARDTQLWSL